ncbi:RNA polymerase sigma factor [Agriterribacter humi]|uniref:RNA polymerase sigma factor n=1 Tax=Agriterribacter humi TaxID=1104781 RepID=UPI001D027274|nr:sigma-70 family RNA polymerase sigma factor [Agriterribacter humi]
MNFIKNISTADSTDTELIVLYKQTKDMRVLSDLYQRYMELVYGVCLKYFKDAEQSKDAVMNIFEELVEKLKLHEVSNFKSWLHTLTRNHCLMQLRTPRNLKTTEFNQEYMQSAETVHLNGMLEKEEQFVKLEKCIQTLSEEQKKTVELFYLQQKCYDEIAEITGYEWNKVRSYIQNGRRNLKSCMEA